MSRRPPLALLALALLAAPARADERPPTKNLVWAGLAMAPPTFLIGTAVHEGSHALAAKLSGAEVTDFSIIPGFHPRNGKFYFGYVSVRGLRGDGERVAFYLAPKLTDAVLLGGFALAVGTDALPDDRYGQLAFTVLATGFWVDFSKDVFAFWDHNDLVKAYDLLGLESEWERLPARLLHAGLSAATAWAVVQGYQDVFADEPAAAPLLLPLLSGRF